MICFDSVQASCQERRKLIWWSFGEIVPGSDSQIRKARQCWIVCYVDFKWNFACLFSSATLLRDVKALSPSVRAAWERMRWWEICITSTSHIWFMIFLNQEISTVYIFANCWNGELGTSPLSSKVKKKYICICVVRITNIFFPFPMCWCYSQFGSIYTKFKQ